MQPYRIEYGGITAPPDAWGVTVQNLTLINQESDELILETTTNAIAAPVFTYGNTLSLYRGTVRVFAGVVVETPAIGNIESEGTSYRVKGPWWYLEQAAFMQGRVTYGEVTDPSATPVTSLTSRVVLGMTDISTPINNAQQIINAINYAVTTYGIPILIGDITVDIRPPYSEERDITVAEVVKKMLRYQPDAIAWFDYSTSTAGLPTPTIHIKPRASLDAVSFDLDAADSIAQVSCTPRHDLVPSGVLFIFEQPVSVSITSGSPPVTTLEQRIRITSQVAGAGGSQLGAIVQTFQLAGTSFGNAEVSGPVFGEPVPVSFATKYYATLSTLQYEGELLLLEENVTQLVSMGEVLNLTESAMPEWATMNALVQQVSYDFAAGLTRVTFGPAEHLNAGDFYSLINQNQNPNPSDFPLTRDGGQPPGPPNPRPPAPPEPGSPPAPFNPTPYVDLEVCDPPGTVRVNGFRN